MTIGITATPTVLVEEEGTVVTLTLTSTDPIPDGGLVLTIDSGATRASVSSMFLQQNLPMCDWWVSLPKSVVLLFV